MTPKRARNLLLYAIVASLLLHALLALVARWPTPREAQPQNVAITHARIVTIHHVATVPPPPATPHPRVALAPVARRAPPKRIALPRLSRAASGATAPLVQTATAAPSAPPSPAPCASPNAPAALAGSPPPAPSLAPDVRAQHVSGVSRVAVRVSASGSVLDAKIAASSGSPSLDVAAIAMARDATYAPAYAKCKAIAGDYTFSVRWAAW